jgi:hypothetical protein
MFAPGNSGQIFFIREEREEEPFQTPLPEQTLFFGLK